MTILPKPLAEQMCFFLFGEPYLKFTPQKFPQTMFHKTSPHNRKPRDLCEELTHHNARQQKPKTSYRNDQINNM